MSFGQMRLKTKMKHDCEFSLNLSNLDGAFYIFLHLKNNFMKRLWLLLPVLLAACQSPAPKDVQSIPVDRVVTLDSLSNSNPYHDSPTEARLRGMGLLNIADLDSTIYVNLKYATSDNFMGKVLYKDLHKAFVLPEMANKILKAKAILQASHPGYNFMIYDAARPVSIQSEMWDKVKNTDKCDFVANPAKGHGMHNYGAAVDITIVDAQGHPLPMGTSFDYFGDEARITHEQTLLDSGKITRQELYNRQLLRTVMTKAGLRPMSSEWWHFNLMRPSEAKDSLILIP